MTLMLKKYLFQKNGANNAFKFVIGYNDNDDIRPLCIMLPQMIGYVKCFKNKNNDGNNNNNKNNNNKKIIMIIIMIIIIIIIIIKDNVFQGY